MKPYNQKGKKFSKTPSKFWARLDDVLLSYEDMNKINDYWRKYKPRHGFSNLEKDKKLTLYVPKKTQNKKDVIAAHKRSGKKTERTEAKRQILEDLSNFSYDKN